MPIINYNGNWGGYLEYSTETVSQSTSNNTSTIRVNVWVGIKQYNSVQFGNTYGDTVDITVGGDRQSVPVGPLYINGSKKHLGSRDFVFRHNSDGTGRAEISFNSNMNNIAYAGLVFGVASGSHVHYLPTIPRSSSVSISGQTIGQTMRISINRQSSSFTHRIRYAWGRKSGTIADNVSTSHDWQIPMDFCNDIPNSISGIGTIYVDTYSGWSLTGTQSIPFTAYVPESAKPSFSGVTLEDTNSTVKSILQGNNFLQIMSNIKVTFNGQVGSYGSSIKGYSAELVNRNQFTSENGGKLGIMNFNGSATIRAKVIDTRGRFSEAKEVTINVVEYFPPIISFTSTRTKQFPDKIQVIRNVRIAPITVNGSQKNTMTVSFKVSELNKDNFVNDTGEASSIFTTLSTLQNSAANLGGTYAPDKSYEVLGIVTDRFTSSQFKPPSITTEEVVIGYRKDGRVGVGKIPENGGPGSLDVKGEIFSNNVPMGFYGTVLAEDLDKLYRAAIYEIDPSTKNRPIPGNNWGYVEVIVSNGSTHNNYDNWIWQTYKDTKGNVRTRYKVNHHPWKPWVAPGIDNFYPVGSIYQSTSSTNPSDLMGGTWERFGNGKVLIGVDETNNDFNQPKKTGGSYSHRHDKGDMVALIGSGYASPGTLGFHHDNNHKSGTPTYVVEGKENAGLKSRTLSHNTALAGNTGYASSLQPYVTIYRWRRTA